ncbi:outer membrane lipoprotein-sorting protein [Hyphobacterium sp. CCMP332]|nr:outer membrane lipoprotein-sorting protein [Hyphobacterium sp. CCMP332]
MKTLNIFFILNLIFCTSGFSQDAKEIIRRVDEKIRGNSSKANMTIEIVRPKWTREMTLTSWSKGDDYSITLINSPARDKGTVFLKRDKEIWNWVPSIDRNIKLPPSMMMQSWMGTDFTNDDLVKQSSIVTDYEHRYLKDSTIEGFTCYVIELIPKPDAPVVWGRIKIWVDKIEYMQMRTEYYDEDEYLVNIMTGSLVKIFDGKKLPSRMEMIPVEKKGQKTVIIYNDLEFDIDISDNFFTTQNMKRL